MFVVLEVSVVLFTFLLYLLTPIYFHNVSIGKVTGS
jgi:hypothetical protein